MAGKKGRPTTFTQSIADRICFDVIQGKTIRTICKVEDMPAMSTVFKWLSEKNEFSEQWKLAKELQTEALNEEILDISDDGTNDWMEDQYMKGKSPGWKVNGEAVQRSKLRVDTRKWVMSKMKPKKYGDKMDVTSDGKAIQGNTIVVKDFTDATGDK